jgi:hypothetical protein
MIRGGGYAFRDKKGILRLISMILWPIKIVSILAAAGILLSVTFSLGMFHAAGSLFFPMFDLGDLHQSLILSLPGIVTCLVFVLTGVMILPSDRKRDPDVMRHHGIWQNWVSSAVVVVAGIAFSAVLGDVLGAGFVGALLLTVATALIASRLRKKFAAAGSGGLAPLARLVVVIVPIMFMFWSAYFGWAMFKSSQRSISSRRVERI